MNSVGLNTVPHDLCKNKRVLTIHEAHSDNVGRKSILTCFLVVVMSCRLTVELGQGLKLKYSHWL